jgi:DNA-binding transcriptional ArsR family regulator
MTNTNHIATIAFFAATDAKTKTEILAAIAKHYGISKSEALEEVTDEEAESLLDYLTGSIRTATSLLMKRHGIAA